MTRCGPPPSRSRPDRSALIRRLLQGRPSARPLGDRSRTTSPTFDDTDDPLKQGQGLVCGVADPLCALVVVGEAHRLHKHLWRLAIPEFELSVELHGAISDAGVVLAAGAQGNLEELRKRRGDEFTVTIARRELRHCSATRPKEKRWRIQLPGCWWTARCTRDSRRSGSIQ